ncbi:hypothetical protein WJX75_009735 [Coccomyxa subellipsoidea]|uniref:Uncharacterized protein n=1 Tax=Coccomyxa subellipsoidea TaxID=248742 RepID=A0ABR2YED9_9CHLO
MDVHQVPYPGNSFYINAMTALIDCPCLDFRPAFPQVQPKSGHRTPYPKEGQLECVLILLRAKAAMTVIQLDELLRMIYIARGSQEEIIEGL